MTIHAEVHEVLLNYIEDMVEIQKIRNFMDVIKFVPMYSGKYTVLSHAQMSNDLSSTINDLAYFIQNKNMDHFREISAAGQGN